MPDHKRSNRFLLAGGILFFVPGILLWLLPKLARTPEEAGLLVQAIGQSSGRNLGLELFLWGLLVVGLTLLICGLKLRVPNPEDIQFEKDWEKKGR
jgi:hypothetical protein